MMQEGIITLMTRGKIEDHISMILRAIITIIRNGRRMWFECNISPLADCGKDSWPGSIDSINDPEVTALRAIAKSFPETMEASLEFVDFAEIVISRFAALQNEPIWLARPVSFFLGKSEDRFSRVVEHLKVWDNFFKRWSTAPFDVPGSIYDGALLSDEVIVASCEGFYYFGIALIEFSHLHEVLEDLVRKRALVFMARSQTVLEANSLMGIGEAFVSNERTGFARYLVDQGHIPILCEDRGGITPEFECALLCRSESVDVRSFARAIEAM